MSDHPRLPFGFANATRRDGAAVVKEYVGNAAADRWATEAAALADVEGLLPVPRMLEATENPPMLRLAYVEGSPASLNLTEDVLYRMGTLLRDFQSAYCARTRLVRVHGDFGPNNILIGADGAIAAVIDWEWSRFGDPLTDAAWMEWALRIHYPGADPGPFYEGYGRTPSWAERHLSMVESVAWRAQRWISDPGTWDARLDATLRLVEPA